MMGMSNLPNTVKDITTAIFRGGINQGNRTADIPPVYTELQTMIPEEGARRIARIIAREKIKLLEATKHSTPEEVDARIAEYDKIAKRKVVI